MHVFMITVWQCNQIRKIERLQLIWKQYYYYYNYKCSAYSAANQQLRGHRVGHFTKFIR